MKRDTETDLAASPCVSFESRIQDSICGFTIRFTDSRLDSQIPYWVCGFMTGYADPLLDQRISFQLFYLLFLRNGRIVFSFESALYLHGLMDREPSKTTVTVPEGYNASHIVARGVRVIHAKKDWYEIGISVINTAFGNEVPVYDKERTICDIIRNKNYIEIQTFQTAIREYMGGKGKNLGNLISYARYLGIEDEVRTYTEVMLL